MIIDNDNWIIPMTGGDYGWRLIDDGWWRSWLIITDDDWWQHDLLLIMMIIIDVHNHFNFDNYHDGWLVGDHMMIMDSDYDLCRLIDDDCYWVIMMIIMTDDLLIMIEDW